MDVHSYSKKPGLYIDESSDEDNDEIVVAIDDFDFKLIENVKKFPCLYNKNNKEKNVNDAWTSISSSLNTSVQECQTRWAYLRKQYPKERKKRETSEVVSAINKLSLYDIMKWIDPFVPRRRSKTRCKTSIRRDNSVASQSLNNAKNVQTSCENNVLSESIVTDENDGTINSSDACSTFQVNNSQSALITTPSSVAEISSDSADSFLQSAKNAQNQFEKLCDDISTEESMNTSFSQEIESSSNYGANNIEKHTLPIENFNSLLTDSDDESMQRDINKYSVSKLHEQANNQLREITDKFLNTMNANMIEKEKRQKSHFNEENHICGKLITTTLKKMNDPFMQKKIKSDICKILYED